MKRQATVARKIINYRIVLLVLEIPRFSHMMLLGLRGLSAKIGRRRPIPVLETMQSVGAQS